MKYPWLAAVSWDLVTKINLSLCSAKNALHKPTSDGHDVARTLWESKFHEPLTLSEATSICRECHRLAPFCFFNGNTFATIARDMIEQIPLSPERAYVAEQAIGHIVAGTDFGEEQEVLALLSREIDDLKIIPVIP